MTKFEYASKTFTSGSAIGSLGWDNTPAENRPESKASAWMNEKGAEGWRTINYTVITLACVIVVMEREVSEIPPGRPTSVDG